MQTKHLLHKHGGRITAITGYGHRTIEKVPYWFFLCDVTWDDGTSRKEVEVLPDRICYGSDNPEGKAECDKAMGALSEHLRKHGRWLKKGKWIGDRLVHWVAKQPILVQTI